MKFANVIFQKTKIYTVLSREHTWLSQPETIIIKEKSDDSGGRSAMKRIAQVIRVKPEKLELYRQLHLNPWKAVAEEIERCNICLLYTSRQGRAGRKLPDHLLFGASDHHHGRDGRGRQGGDGRRVARQGQDHDRRSAGDRGVLPPDRRGCLYAGRGFCRGSRRRLLQRTVNGGGMCDEHDTASLAGGRSGQQAGAAHTLLSRGAEDRRQRPVSYTHLDVYKRQLRHFAQGRIGITNQIHQILTSRERYIGSFNFAFAFNPAQIFDVVKLFRIQYRYRRWNSNGFNIFAFRCV